ncbi:HNH endonuclease [Paenibacillus jamilae]|uniref:HNH endonuclease n=1 Tax=Paenibacillus jamilae TaxID=114136 RepID=UPI00073751DC|nr:HNH endonuclease [Paenibacillus jamilae]
MKNKIQIIGTKAVIFVPYKGERVEVLVDAVRVPDIADFRWTIRFNKQGGIPYVSGYRFIGHRGHRLREDVYLHRLLTTAPPGMVVDHINGDTLDNTTENLRVVSHAENRQNITVAAWSASGVRNVYPQPNGKYRVQIGHDGELHSFGSYDSLYEAEQVAIRERHKLHTFSNPLARREFAMA